MLKKILSATHKDENILPQTIFCIKISNHEFFLNYGIDSKGVEPWARINTWFHLWCIRNALNLEGITSNSLIWKAIEMVGICYKDVYVGYKISLYKLSQLKNWWCQKNLLTLSQATFVIVGELSEDLNSLKLVRFVT